MEFIKLFDSSFNNNNITKQGSIKNTAIDSNKANDLLRSFANLTSTPYFRLQHPEFKNFTDELNNTFKIDSHVTFANKTYGKDYKDCMEETNKMCKDIEGVTIVIDEVSDNDKSSMIGIIYILIINF